MLQKQTLTLQLKIHTSVYLPWASSEEVDSLLEVEPCLIGSKVLRALEGVEARGRDI